MLPICLSCKAVKTSEGTWEEASSFLLRHADFLSHAYCAPCAEKYCTSLEEEV